MEFPSTKFTVQQAWQNQQRNRVDTLVLRKLAPNTTCLHIEANSEVARKRIRNNGKVIPEGKENRIFYSNFFKTNDTIGRGTKVDAFGNTLFDVNSNSSISSPRLSNQDDVNATNSSQNLHQASFNIEHTHQPRTLTRPVKNFKSQLPLNGCANNMCEIKTTRPSPISDLLNISNRRHRRRRRVSDAYDVGGGGDNDAKNFNVYDNQINENLMRTKRPILKAHQHRIDTTKKLYQARFNINVTDYPINVNFHSSSRRKHFKNGEFNTKPDVNHRCVLLATNRSDNSHRNVVNETGQLKINVTGNRFFIS